MTISPYSSCSFSSRQAPQNHQKTTKSIVRTVAVCLTTALAFFSSCSRFSSSLAFLARQATRASTSSAVHSCLFQATYLAHIHHHKSGERDRYSKPRFLCVVPLVTASSRKYAKLQLSFTVSPIPSVLKAFHMYNQLCLTGLTYLKQ
jgi:hypothetical protein